MALLWLDAFELDAAGIRARYNTTVNNDNTVSSASGRTGQYTEIKSTVLVKNITATTGIVMGWAKKHTSFANTDFVRLSDSGGAIQFTLRENSNGTISLYRGDPTAGGTLLATSVAMSTGFWIYYELKVFVDNTTGSYELRANEAMLLSASGVDTQQTANANIAKVAIGNNTTASGIPTGNFVDDYYIANLDSPMPLGDFYGNLKIERLAPSGAGTTTQWTPSAGSNYQNVDETTHNSDTDYNASATVGNIDTYAMADMAASSGNIRGVQTTLVARKDDALTREIAPVMRSGSTDYVGATKTLTTSYAYYFQQYDQDPDTSADWDFTGVNAVEVGVKVIT